MGSYIIYISVIIVFLGISIFFIKKGKSQNDSKNSNKPIECGYISVFFDAGRNITIIPYVKNNLGIGKAISEPRMLQSPYEANTLGRLVRTSMEACNNAFPGTDEELMGKLGFRRWNDFSEDKKNISVHYDEKYGIVMNTTIRLKDSSYQFLTRGPDMILDKHSSNNEIGEALMSLMPKCRLIPVK